MNDQRFVILPVTTDATDANVTNTSGESLSDRSRSVILSESEESHALDYEILRFRSE